MSLSDWFVRRSASAANGSIRGPGTAFEQLEPRLLLSASPDAIFFLHQSCGEGIMLDHGGQPGLVNRLAALGHTFSDYDLWNDPPGGSEPPSIATLFADANTDGIYGDGLQAIGATSADVLMLKSCFYVVEGLTDSFALGSWQQSFIDEVAAYANQNPQQSIVAMPAVPLRSEAGFGAVVGERARDWSEWLAGDFRTVHCTAGNVYSFNLFDFWADAETHATNANWLRREYCLPGADNHPNDAGYRAAAEEITSFLQAEVLPSSPTDTTPPTPNPSTWATQPYATGPTSIRMVATSASDPGGVEYYFDCLIAGGHDSSWQGSPAYEDTGLSPSTAYTYQVRTRDASPGQNTGSYSVPRAATTEAPPAGWVQPQSLPYAQDFGTGKPGAVLGWQYYYGHARGRIEVVEGALRMDVRETDIGECLNEAILHVDAAGCSRIVLTLDHRNQGDDEDVMPEFFQGHTNADGIAVSADGVNWYRVISLIPSFTGKSLHLDTIVRNAGIGYTSDFQIKFQQFGNHPWGTDGRSIDNISVAVGYRPSFGLDPMASDQYAVGQSAEIPWTATDVPPGSLVSLCYDEDLVWCNGNEHWIVVDRPISEGPGSYAWDTSPVPAGTYYVAGYMWDYGGTAIISQLTGPVTIAEPSLSLVAPVSGTIAAGQPLSIEWTAGGMVPGSTISLCYDEDTTWLNGNEHWIVVDTPVSQGPGAHVWNTSGVAPGTYYLAGYTYDGGATFTVSQLAEPIALVEPGLTLTAPAGVAASVGNIVNIEWTATGTLPASTISLCYDEDTVWLNGNERWITIDAPVSEGPGSYAWNTSGVAPGTYYVAGYTYDWGSTFSISQLAEPFTLVQPSLSLAEPAGVSAIVGDQLAIVWMAEGMLPASTISLCYDEDTVWCNGNEHWVVIDAPVSAGPGLYAWDTLDAAPGTYYVAGYVYDWNGTFTVSQLTEPVTLDPPSFALSAPAGVVVSAGDTVDIEWTVRGAVPASTISLCYDEDTAWMNGNEHWIVVDTPVPDGPGAYEWNTSGVAPGAYYMAGYIYDWHSRFIISQLMESIEVV
ncbi:MAG: LEPR-XLL domain-containing protein [Phycisphaerae bacterium]